MKTKRRWLWVIFFIFFIAILTVLATRWNLSLLERHAVTWEFFFGTLGFIVLLVGFVLFFTRLLQEMRLNQLQSEFLAAISHEFRTPLATLELTSNLLRTEDDLDPAQKEKLWGALDKELKRLRNEVDSLLEAARWEAKSIQVSRQTVALEDWIQSQWAEWSERLGADAEFTRVGTFAPHVHARVDPRLFSLIWINLIENARKFAMGKPQVRLSSRLLPEGGWEMRIDDAGWGFPPADAKKLFRRFHRGKAIAPYSIAGSGLGLYLVRAAAARMKITVTAESEGAGKGASFRLRGRTHE